MHESNPVLMNSDAAEFDAEQYQWAVYKRDVTAERDLGRRKRVSRWFDVFEEASQTRDLRESLGNRGAEHVYLIRRDRGDKMANREISKYCG